MSEALMPLKGWKPIPLALKTLSLVMILWSVGSAMNLANLLENGLPLLGRFVHGFSAFLVVLLLDFIGPAVFLYALWNGKPWGPKWAFFYIGLFIINGLIALLTVRDQLGLMQILVPDFVCAIFLAVIFWKRAYFART
jgi:hypothetical protein